jgi:hypothetical protein
MRNVSLEYLQVTVHLLIRILEYEMLFQVYSSSVNLNLGHPGVLLQLQ